jgi:hypothetical protein
MQKIIITTTILSLIISLSSARVLTKNNPMASKDSSSHSSSHSISQKQKDNVTVTVSHKKIDKDDDVLSHKSKDSSVKSKIQANEQWKNVAQKVSDSLSNKSDDVSPATKNQANEQWKNIAQNPVVVNDFKAPVIEMKQSHFDDVMKSEESSHKQTDKMFNAVTTHVVNNLNDQIRSQNQALMKQNTSHKTSEDHHSSSCSHPSHSHFNKSHDNESAESMNAKELMKNAIAKKVEDMKQNIQNGSVVLNETVEDSRKSSDTSSLKTNSHATHSHATNETCTRLDKESSHNSDVIEETTVKTNSKVLDESKVESSHVSEVKDSREDSSEGVKLFASFAGMIALIFLA